MDVDFIKVLLLMLLYYGGKTLLLCLAVAAAWCAPFVAVYLIRYVVRRINRRDENRAVKPFGDVNPEIIENLTPHQRDVLESYLRQHPRWPALILR